MSFATPQMFWLFLLVLPPLIFFLWWAWRKREELIRQFISPRLLAILKVGVSPQRQKLRMVLLVLAVVFLILTLARPRWGYTLEEARQQGLDIIVAIDTSNSMLAEDVPPNRLARAKLAAKDLMRRAKADRLGVVAFAGAAFLECPLTLDDAAFSQSVDALDTKTISDGGTALSEAIDTADKAFGDEPDNHKVLVLFTDGEDNDGGAVEAAQKAAKDGLRIYTIGIGSPEGVQLRIRDEQGHVDYIRDEAGNPVTSRLNEALLKEIASAANGFYLNLRGTKTVDMLYDHPQGLASLPKSTNYSQKLRHYNERFQWPVSVAIALLLFQPFWPDRKRRRAKTEAAAPATLGAAAQTTVVLLLLTLPLSVRGSPASALREYESGKYDDAFQDYSHLLEKGKDDPRLHFDAGAAAYQSHHLDQAAKEFDQVLTSPDLKLQENAYYNLGNTYYRMGQAGAQGAPSPGGNQSPGGPDMDAMQKAWEQAIEHYDSALKLNPTNADAKFNQSFVQKRLEELKKQQQQQQSKNDKNKDDKKDQKDKQDQSKNDSQNQQNKDSKDSKDQQGKDKDSNQQDKGSQSKNQKQDEKKSEQAQQKKADEEKKAQAQKKKDQADKKDKDQDEQAQSGGQKKDQDKADEEAREAAMMAAGQMTPQQAQQLLDAQKGQEEVLRFVPPENKPARQSGFIKNW